MRREKHVSDKYVRRVRRFVEFLGDLGLLRQKATSAVPVLDRRVVEFQHWLRQHRGISEKTIDRHGRMVMRLLPALGPRPEAGTPTSFARSSRRRRSEPRVPM